MYLNRDYISEILLGFIRPVFQAVLFFLVHLHSHTLFFKTGYIRHTKEYFYIFIFHYDWLLLWLKMTFSLRIMFLNQNNPSQFFLFAIDICGLLNVLLYIYLNTENVEECNMMEY